MENAFLPRLKTHPKAHDLLFSLCSVYILAYAIKICNNQNPAFIIRLYFVTTRDGSDWKEQFLQGMRDQLKYTVQSGTRASKRLLPFGGEGGSEAFKAEADG